MIRQDCLVMFGQSVVEATLQRALRISRELFSTWISAVTAIAALGYPRARVGIWYERASPQRQWLKVRSIPERMMMSASRGKSLLTI